MHSGPLSLSCDDSAMTQQWDTVRNIGQCDALSTAQQHSNIEMKATKQ